MSLEANLKNITEIAKQKAEENSAFKGYLKVQNVEEVDTIVQTLNHKITPQIDCSVCCRN